MERVVIISQADYVALCSAVHDAYTDVSCLDVSYIKDEILRKLDNVKDLLQIE